MVASSGAVYDKGFIPVCPASIKNFTMFFSLRGQLFFHFRMKMASCQRKSSVKAQSQIHPLYKHCHFTMD